MIPLYNSMSPETNFGTLISIIPFNSNLIRKYLHLLRLSFDNEIDVYFQLSNFLWFKAYQILPHFIVISFF